MPGSTLSMARERRDPDLARLPPVAEVYRRHQREIGNAISCSRMAVAARALGQRKQPMPIWILPPTGGSAPSSGPTVSIGRLRRLLSISLLRRYPALTRHLLHLHASLSLISSTHHLFGHLLLVRAQGDAFPWNCLIAGYAHLNCHEDALALYL
ncbi:hypothetical protein E2562_018646 [Oryza meyeriana var. granulata]|uniref:Pentatricopeptide repeat-containing protein n=1 Tax=Oryza meyeriana var. granulata TaxID=110450 RepID=A0A6G1BZP5_9ORYZ|nr:hypothetical protein E2562_018646 [Oryza meyeriana var. granulata]